VVVGSHGMEASREGILGAALGELNSVLRHFEKENRKGQRAEATRYSRKPLGPKRRVV